MASAKITALAALTGANSAPSDVIAMVDTSASTTSKMTRDELQQGLWANNSLVHIQAGGAQSVTGAANEFVKVLFDVERYDVRTDEADLANNKITLNTVGKYIVSAGLQSPDLTDVQSMDIVIYKQGVLTYIFRNNQSGTNALGSTISRLMEVTTATGHDWELYVRMSASSRSLSSSLLGGTAVFLCTARVG